LESNDAQIMGRFGITGLVIAFASILGCDGNKESAVPPRIVSQEALIQFNQQKLAEQTYLLDSIAQSWDEEFGRPNQISPTGLRVWADETGTSEACLLEGDTIEWIGVLSLLDSTVLYQWSPENPLRFYWNRSDWPVGFHELAALLCDEGGGLALIPSHQGWGLTGWPPLIPQDAVLVVEVEQSVRPMGSRRSETPLPNPHRRRWNRLLDDFETGEWFGIPGWIDRPQLAASPCLAWYDPDSRFDAEPEQVTVSMRTWHLASEAQNCEELGFSTWEFSMHDEGQLLPVIAHLHELYPTFRRWECWCPVDLAFSSRGVPEADVQPEDVMGFQWELTSSTALGQDLTSVQ
jgi:hypothetical protein